VHTFRVKSLTIYCKACSLTSTHAYIHDMFTSHFCTNGLCTHILHNDETLGGDSQNFLRKFVRFYLTLSLKIIADDIHYVCYTFSNHWLIEGVPSSQYHKEINTSVDLHLRLVFSDQKKSLKLSRTGPCYWFSMEQSKKANIMNIISNYFKAQS